MIFEFEKYFKLIFDKKLDEAIIYRKKCMPKKLYKYISLSDNIVCSKDNKNCFYQDNINELKFNALTSNKIWMSRFNNLNDPYEYKAMYLKRNELTDKGWPLEMLEGYIERIKSTYLIASFTKNLVDNMPMWAHYTNNHRGFCIEYSILNPKVVFPISYEDERFGIGSILTDIFALTDKIYNGEIDEHNKDFQFFMTLITHFGLVKHTTWEYENEFRILHADKGGSNHGLLVSNINVGIQVDRIFVGSQCSKDNKNRLSEIANQIGTEIYEMYLDDYEPNYKLSYRPI